MNSRRNFLAGLGAATLAPHALPHALSGNLRCLPPGNGHYVVGTVSNPLLPAPAGSLVLKVWLSVDGNGTGFGILTDRYGPTSNSHLEVQSAGRVGHRHTWTGVVARSNEPLLVGQPFVLSADARGDVASLELLLTGQTFAGSAILTP